MNKIRRDIFFIRKLNFFSFSSSFFSLCAHFSFSLQCYLFSIHFLILLISFISLQRQMKIIWAAEMENSSYFFCVKHFFHLISILSFFGNNQRSFSFSTCLNINLIFHYLNWFHLNEIFCCYSLSHSHCVSLERLLCVRIFLYQRREKKEKFCWAVIYLFEVLCLLSLLLTHPPPTSLSLFFFF